jgi:hypothetical protein
MLKQREKEGESVNLLHVSVVTRLSLLVPTIGINCGFNGSLAVCTASCVPTCLDKGLSCWDVR